MLVGHKFSGHRWLANSLVLTKQLSCRSVHYAQGQSDPSNAAIREYFYYIDHQGMLFLDDSRMKNFTSCFKDKQFLHFFFSRLRLNESGRYSFDFPFVSMCGRERNLARAEDVPVVFTEVLDDGRGGQRLAYGHAGHLLTVDFQPDKLCMPISGRVYHPAMDSVGGVGLVKSSLAFEMSKCFRFASSEQDEMPTHFVWQDKTYKLTNELLAKIKLKKNSTS